MAASAVVQTAVDTDPDLVSGFVLELGDFNVTLNFVYQWATDDPVVALRWADQNLDGDERIEIVGIALPNWLQANPDAAMRFIARLERGRASDRIVYRALKDLRGDPQLSERLRETIRDPELKERATQLLDASSAQ